MSREDIIILTKDVSGKHKEKGGKNYEQYSAD